MPRADALITAVAKQDLTALRAALAKHDCAPPAQAMMNAGRLAWLPGLKLLTAHGGDLNASFRNYRAIHALIQEKPHEGGSSTPERIACLEWMLDHGADPEQMAAWPAARAVVIAAFTGEQRYVKVLFAHKAKRNVFTSAAVGDAVRVAKELQADPGLALARDGGLLTALQCCAGSRLGAKHPKVNASLLECARLLIEAGADVNARTKTWAHEVPVSYFVIRSGQMEMLRLLLARGMNPTDAVSTACWDRREDMLDLLIGHGADLTKACDQARPVLSELIRWGQFEAARMYLRKGVDPNLTDDKGWTSLHQAVSRGNLRMLQDLIAAGGDPRRASEDGRTPRGMAKKAGRDDLLRVLDA